MAETIQKPKPILFSKDLIPSIKNGTKTMTRRPISPQPKIHEGETGKWEQMDDRYTFQLNVDGYSNFIYDYPVKVRYLPGDALYVQEAWQCKEIDPDNKTLTVCFRDGEIKTGTFTDERFEKFKKFYNKNGWMSPYFMPIEVARIFIEITESKVEYLHDIPTSEIEREGVNIDDLDTREKCLEALKRIWDEAYTNGWDLNPVVAAYGFKLKIPS